MSLKEFFQKEFKLRPSGKTPHERGVKVSKYAQPLSLSLKGTLGTAAMSVLISACSSPPYSKIDFLKESMPERERREAALSYDDALLYKIDSLRLDAGMPMLDAVSKALDETERQTLPADTALWTAKDYVLSDHAQQRRNEALTPVNLFGWNARRVNQDFRDDLRKSILKEEKALGEGAVAARVIVQSRRVR